MGPPKSNPLYTTATPLRLVDRVVLAAPLRQRWRIVAPRLNPSSGPRARKGCHALPKPALTKYDGYVRSNRKPGSSWLISCAGSVASRRHSYAPPIESDIEVR